MAKIGQITILAPRNQTHVGTVIFLHGSQDTGQRISRWISSLLGDFSLPYIKFLFPTAPVRPYTAGNGRKIHVWFDRYTANPSADDHEETIISIGEEMKKLIQTEVETGIPRNKIIVVFRWVGRLHYRLLIDLCLV